MRYIPKKDFHCVDRKGRKRFYRARHTQPDGSLGYVRDEVTDLYRNHLSMFVQAETVEQATAAPGEIRTLPQHRCDDCGDDFKTAAALGSHKRVHDE